MNLTMNSTMIKPGARVWPKLVLQLQPVILLHEKFLAVYKSGTGTRGRGRGDACVGSWELGTRDEGLEDIKYGRGDVKTRDAGDASFFVKMCYLWSTLDSIFQNQLGHLMMFTQNISL